MRKNILHCFIIALGIFSGQAIAQDNYNVLFIGNSYTGVNNLPQMVADIAASKGDQIEFDSHTPGGNTFEQHSVNPAALAKIELGNWDYVVLQEQSQRPSFSPGQVADEVYPYAEVLCNAIRLNNPCATPLFYMTWGRENGDADNCGFYPPVCTYEGMQERLTASYTEMAENNDYAAVSPVGEAWKALRDSNPDIQLYTGDGSHPSIHGSYLAACVFYSSISHKSCIGVSHPASISDPEAAIIQSTANNTVFDRIDEWFMPHITADIQDDEITFSLNTNDLVTVIEWTYADGQSSNETTLVLPYDADTEYAPSVNFQYDTCNDGVEISSTLNGLSTIEYEEIDLIQLNGKQFQINNKDAQEVFIRVHNTNGQLVFEKRSKEMQIKLDMNGYTAGTYLISVQNNHTQSSKKLLIY